MEDYTKILKIFGRLTKWLPIIYKKLQPFRPEAKYFEINYKSKEAIIRYFLSIPPSIRKRIGKIEIPRYENFEIQSFMDDSFNDITNLIKIDEAGMSWIIKTNQLPSCQNFLIVLNGKINSHYIEELVNVKPATNKDSTKTFDKYWLNVMIRDVSVLEKLYNKLEVNDINCIVKVGIEKSFTTDMPKPLRDAINAFKNYIDAAYSRDRKKAFDAWRNVLRHTQRWDLKTLDDIIKDLSSKMTLIDYIKIDDPFYLGTINNPETEKIIPSFFSVEALTNLTLDNPAASGYLKFHKINYQKEVKDKIGTKWDEFRKDSKLRMH